MLFRIVRPKYCIISLTRLFLNIIYLVFGARNPLLGGPASLSSTARGWSSGSMDTIASQNLPEFEFNLKNFAKHDWKSSTLMSPDAKLLAWRRNAAKFLTFPNAFRISLNVLAASLVPVARAPTAS